MQFLIGQCHAAFVEYSSIFMTLFLAGLVGGVTHCAAMCGPFVLAQTSSNVNRSVNALGVGVGCLKKLSGWMLLPYHLGRASTYIFLGMAAAFFSRQIVGLPVHSWLSIFFLIVAGCLFILTAWPGAKKSIRELAEVVSSRIKSPFCFLKCFLFTKRGARVENAFSVKSSFAKTIESVGSFIGGVAGPLMVNSTGTRGYFLGLLLGFLPCGLVFSALIIVSTTADLFAAALGMALFALGTVPSLILVGVGGHFLHQAWPNRLQKIARVVMVFNGCSLFILAGNMILWQRG